MINTISDKILDEIDRKILFALDQDSRQSLAQLSKKLRLGRDRIGYRLKNLTNRGILRRYTTGVNPYKFGLWVNKTYLKLEHNQRRIKELRTALLQHPRTYWVADCSGQWDLIIGTFAKNPHEFHSIQTDILTDFSDIILSFSYYILVKAWFFPKSYLTGIVGTAIPVGGEPSALHLDETDFQILRYMSDNSRLSNIEIARKVGITPIVVAYRVKKLERLGIISGYRIELDRDLLGMSFFKAQIHLYKHDRSNQQQFFEYCRQNPNVTYLIEQLGDCRLEIELEVSDYEHYMSIIDEIMQRFQKFIRGIDTIVIRKEHFKWVPADIVAS